MLFPCSLFFYHYYYYFVALIFITNYEHTKGFCSKFFFLHFTFNNAFTLSQPVTIILSVYIRYPSVTLTTNAICMTQSRWRGNAINVLLTHFEPFATSNGILLYFYRDPPRTRIVETIEIDVMFLCKIICVLCLFWDLRLFRCSFYSTKNREAKQWKH